MSNKSISYKSLKVRQETDYPVSPFLALLRIRPKVFSYKGFVSRQTLSPAEQTGIPMTIDHIIPRAKGGVSNEDNLCLACSRCNGRKRDQTRARDPRNREMGTAVSSTLPAVDTALSVEQPWDTHHGPHRMRTRDGGGLADEPS